MEHHSITGTETGDICNRNGCAGIIAESPKHGSCSCHINPPCFHCTDDNHYCPSCNWQGIDDQQSYQVPVSAAQGMYNRMMQREDNQRDKINRMRNGEIAADKITWYPEGHTHFTMKKIGVYPEGVTQEQVRKEVVGTFGGRFSEFDNGRFTYIAYTD